MPPAQLIPLSPLIDFNGALLVIEENSSPFPLRRAFVVVAGEGQKRGNHAHKMCSQLLVAIRGKVMVSVDDGVHVRNFALTTLQEGLLIPPMNWATQEYIGEEAILMVACDQLFDEADYIRDYAEFIGKVNS